mgnify:CR=1 FL=1
MKLFKGWKLHFPHRGHWYFQLMSPLNENNEGICYNFGLMRHNHNFPWLSKKNFYMFEKFSYDNLTPSC